MSDSCIKEKTITKSGETQDARDADIWVDVCASFCGERLANNPSTQQREREHVRAETPDLGSWEKRKCVLCGNSLTTLSQTDVTKMARNRPDGGNNQQMEGGEECCAPPQGCVRRGGARASPAGTHQEVAWVERWSADFSGGQGASSRSEAAERRSEPVSSPVLEGQGNIVNLRFFSDNR